MQRINTEDGRFLAGDPVNGVPGTMVTSTYMNDLQDEVCNAIEMAGLGLDGTKKNQLYLAMQAIVSTKSLLVVPSTPQEQLASGLIFVADTMSFASWVQTAYYTGYRSLDCGAICYGVTETPRPGEVEAEGDVVPGDDYPSLIAHFQEQGLVVASGSWTPGTYMLGDMGSGQYRLPDLRDQFLRFTGTDLDTANARVLGSWQNNMLSAHRHEAVMRSGVTSGNNATVFANLEVGVPAPNASTMQYFGGAETRPVNMALHPRIRG